MAEIMVHQRFQDKVMHPVEVKGCNVGEEQRPYGGW